MNNSLKHWGVPGMHWGRRKAEYTGPVSSDHARAEQAKQKGFFKITVKDDLVIKTRQKRVKKMEKLDSGKAVESMSNKEIDAFLRKPNVKKQYKAITKSEIERDKR